MITHLAICPQAESGHGAIAGEQGFVVSKRPDQGVQLFEERDRMWRDRPAAAGGVVVTDAGERLVHADRIRLQDLHDPAGLLQQVNAPFWRRDGHPPQIVIQSHVASGGEAPR